MDVHSGVLEPGLPCYTLGSGPPLVVLRWFTPDHANPSGWELRSELKAVGPLARHFTVHAVGRSPGLADGVTMADLAAQLAEALRGRFGEPVDVLGMSSGGSLALQLAADHPDVVRRLVVAGAAVTLTTRTREAQRRYTEAVAAGRRGVHHQASLVGRTPLSRAFFGTLMWLIDPLMRPRDPLDMLRFARAEDSFDLRGRLSGITAPTLVVGGERDLAYSAPLFEETADGVRDGRLIRYPGASHLGTFTHPRFAHDVAEFLGR
ncbi:alpha/beta hydrolase [Nonomuraea sp. NN258]|uniref:alpha/beta fold hydrolase n=1 Tax=Nonomuraea antri TaxID=2730852 RepID=UPI001568B1DD|nr:alpha/beta hydrolase [Nonomuraea antri]NRQ34112.1 alpha/beta hydrolase [Nonomuraea antri]